MMIVIGCHQLEAGFSPDEGGRLVSLRHEAMGDIIRPLTRPIENPMDWPKAGAFPLIPFHGRLVGPRFSFLGRTYAPIGNPFRGGDALHGPAQRRKWSVSRQTPQSLDLTLDYAADEEWPFSFRAEQRFQLASSALTLRLVLQNTGTTPMPGGIGWHPYFSCEPTGDVICDAAIRWLDVHSSSKPALLQTREPRTGSLPHRAFTEHISDWTYARIGLPEGFVTVSAAAPLSHAVLYRTENYICIEPVSHVAGIYAFPAELREKAGFLTLCPGQSIEGRVTVRIEKFVQ